MVDSSEDIISRLYSHVHFEIRKDMDTYLERKDYSFSDIFSSTRYNKCIRFNSLIGYIRLPTTKYLLYDGGLGMGNYIHIYYTLNKGYSLEFSDYSGFSVVNYETDDWNSMKEKIDQYFTSIMK